MRREIRPEVQEVQIGFPKDGQTKITFPDGKVMSYSISQGADSLDEARLEQMDTGLAELVIESALMARRNLARLPEDRMT